MLLGVFSVNTDLPPIGFCIESLLGSKYAGLSFMLGKDYSPPLNRNYVKKKALSVQA
jgi:hypothetical protein